MICSFLFFGQSCPTLWDPMDCSPPRFSFYGIFQARILEWVAISFSRFAISFSKGSSWLRNQLRSPALQEYSYQVSYQRSPLFYCYNRVKCTHTYTYTCICVYVYIYMYIYIYIYIYMNIYAHVHMHIFIFKLKYFFELFSGNPIFLMGNEILEGK